MQESGCGLFLRDFLSNLYFTRSYRKITLAKSRVTGTRPLKASASSTRFRVHRDFLDRSYLHRHSPLPKMLQRRLYLLRHEHRQQLRRIIQFRNRREFYLPSQKGLQMLMIVDEFERGDIGSYEQASGRRTSTILLRLKLPQSWFRWGTAPAPTIPSRRQSCRAGAGTTPGRSSVMF